MDTTLTLSVWEQLRRNEAENRAQFSRAGIPPHKIAQLRCRGCRVVESALFWTPQRRAGHVLHLRCPACGRQGIRYDLRNNSARSAIAVELPTSWRSAVLLGLAIAGLAAISLLLAPRWSSWEAWARVPFHSTPPLARMQPETEVMDAGAVLPALGRWLSLSRRTASPSDAAVYVAPGDRRNDVESYDLEIRSQYGPNTAAALRGVYYLEDEDVTYLLVSSRSREWSAHLAGQDAWTRRQG